MLQRPLIPALILCLMAMSSGCSRGSTPGPRHQSTESDGASAAPGDGGIQADAGGQVDGGGDAASGTAAAEPERWKGIKGRIKALRGSPDSSPVLIAVPDSEAPAKLTKVDSEGAFEVRGLDPGTYRLIVPADGVHSTADMYVTVTDGEPTEVTIPRSEGCPVKIVVRDHDNSTISGAQLKLALPDLPQVSDRRRIEGVTDAEGLVVLTSSCVRGFFEGKVTVPGRGAFDVRHGYVGTGYDQFDIVLPQAADAGVSYANDD